MAENVGNYPSNNCSDTKSRFDVVAINLRDGKEEIEVIQNAFDLEYP
jgi:Holliday junction resolvase-like predicted endonuclease